MNRSLDSKDYLNAARLKMDKMDDPDEGRKVLLNGWKDDNHPELCLKKYFETTEYLDDGIKYVYKNHTGMRKKTAFLTVLADIPKGETEQETALIIAYEIVNQQATRGDHSAMRLLTMFLPKDKLLGQDSYLYILQNHRKPVTIFETAHFQLRQDIQWHFVENYHDQLIGIGIKKQEVFMLRANWEGKTTYEFLFLLAGDARILRLIADGYASPVMILAGKAVPVQTEKNWRLIPILNASWIFQLNWTPPQALAFGLKSDPRELSYFIRTAITSAWINSMLREIF